MTAAWRRRVLAVLALALATSLASTIVAATSGRPLPDRLTDAEFWTIVADFSEPGGAFHSDNFTSNEADYADIAADLSRRPHGAAYLGVGPEQNFSYILALRPAIAFIIDIRRQAVVQHLLFKAIFELSATRADFLTTLFSRPPVQGLARAPLQGIWDAIPPGAGADRDRYLRNRAAVVEHLTRTHGFALSADDLSSLDYVYSAYFALGPEINYGGYQDQLTTGNMNFAKLTLTVDRTGVARSFLASEEAYQYVKDLETRNLVVPIQGDFAGPRAIRAIGGYLKTHEARVGAFYISNVEQYLFGASSARDTDRNGGARRFYENLAALPADADSLLVRGLGLTTVTLCPMIDFLKAVAAGRVETQTAANRVRPLTAVRRLILEFHG